MTSLGRAWTVLTRTTGEGVGLRPPTTVAEGLEMVWEAEKASLLAWRAVAVAAARRYLVLAGHHDFSRLACVLYTAGLLAVAVEAASRAVDFVDVGVVDTAAASDVAVAAAAAAATLHVAEVAHRIL